MIPIRDTIPSKRPPIFTGVLIAINVLIFIYQTIMTDRQFLSFIHEYGLVPADYTDVTILTRLFSFETYFPFVSNIFLHGNWLHLISNMWILWLFGDNIEDSMGHLRYLGFYFLSGIAAGLMHVLFNWASGIPAVGASGAIAGVMGAYMLLFPYSKIVTLIPLFVIVPLFVKIPAVLYLIVWFISQLFYGTVQIFAGEMVGGVGWWAHIGGFIVGLFSHRFFLKRERYS